MRRKPHVSPRRRTACHIQQGMNVRTASAHWPEYLIEAGAIGTFIVSAATFDALFYYPASFAATAVHSELTRRGAMGLAMGLTAMAIIYSRLGQRSGAHMNPAVTLAFFRLGKIARLDAVAYIVAQFVGAGLGLAMVARALPGIVSDPTVNYVTTVPGSAGTTVAFAAELIISFVLMSCILYLSNDRRYSTYTGLCAGMLVCLYITFEAPLSGMSMNPARTLASALLARDFQSLWIYFVAPPLGMLASAELFVRRHGVHRVRCAKLHHPRRGPCHFACAMHAPQPSDIEIL